MIRVSEILGFVGLSGCLVSCAAAMRPHEPTFNERMLQVQETRMKNGENVHGEEKFELNPDPIQSSLWAKSVGSPYIIRNQKASKIGDLITVQINESSSASTQANTDASRETDVEVKGTLSAGQGSLNQSAALDLTSESTNDMKGAGSTDRSGKFQATVQAVVENVLPNGTLFVRGRKVITINQEDQEVELTGFVRPDDIRIDNTVTSNLLADAEIRYLGKGIISDKQMGGWGARLIDWVWPF